ncbi:hypothetical protein MLD38_040237 [Melastoma candidum]|uniref:Uncharacterized protein n=1 Tax=Melastoma candidum TaxID=119954 RepID=A0ACB9L4M5_9MYRT|nr:hypothetical protein MLD38_040237 [Melastoma candidum]
MDRRGNEEEGEGEEVVYLDESFFINDDYRLTEFTFGPHLVQLYCLQSASTDFDLTGQLVWPGATLLNEYLSKNVDILRGCAVIELGSGVGITGILCARFCRAVVLTDHNDEVLKVLNKNIDLQSSLENAGSCASSGLAAEKLEWGNSEHISRILKSYQDGFDLILGADICFQQASIPSLFQTVKQLLQVKGKGKCKFILGYMSRAKMMDVMVVSEATLLGLFITEVPGTRSVVGNLGGVIYEITLI